MPAVPPDLSEGLIARVLEHLVVHGPADLSLGALAQALGTSTFSLSSQFGTKNDMLSAVLERLELRQRTRLATVLGGGPDLGASASIRAVWQSLVDHLDEEQLILELSVRRRSDLAPELRARLTLAWVEAVETILVRAGVPVDLAQAEATLLCAVLAGLEIDLLTTGDRARLDVAVARYADQAATRWTTMAASASHGP